MNNPIELNILLSGDLRKQIDQVGHSEVQTFRTRTSFILYSTNWQGGVALSVLVIHYVIIIHIILLFKVRKDSVIARLLYTGATIRLVESKDPYSDLLLKALPLVHGETSEEVVGESQKCPKGGYGRENFGSAKNWCLLISCKVNFSFFQRRLLEIECCNPPCVGDVSHWASLRFLP